LRSLISIFKIGLVSKRRHIVIDHAIPHKCLNLKTLKPEKTNYNLSYLFEILGHRFVILDDVEIPKPDSKIDFQIRQHKLFKGKNRFYGEYVLLSGLLSKEVRRFIKTQSSELLIKYKNLDNIAENPLQKIAFKKLRRLHKSTRFFLFKYYTYKKFLKKKNILSITSIDENSPRIKTVLDAAKSNKIKTIGIQHGTIHALHPAYIYTDQDKNRSVVPDFTFVWGNYWKEFLIKHGKYPADSLIISGQIRTDIVPVLQNTIEQNFFGLSEGTRLIVFASQPQRDPVLRKQAALDVFKATKENNNTFLVIKLHPAEKNDIGYYRSIAIEAGCENFTIIHDFDLYRLISICDLLITCFSTVGAETVYFKKPLIILDHLKQDIQQYHREGIAFQATTAVELSKLVQKILASELVYDAAAYKNYISKFAYKIDGQAAMRIKEFILGLE